MAQKDAAKIGYFVKDVLPETAGKYELPSLLARTYMAIEGLKKTHGGWMTKSNGLRGYLKQIVPGEPITLDDFNNWLVDVADTRPNQKWTQVNGYESGGYKPFGMGKQGIKIHVSLPRENSGLIATIIASYLNRQEVVYKAISSEENWSALNMGDQRGKAFTVYPRSINESEKIMSELGEMYKTIKKNMTPEEKIAFKNVDLMNEEKIHTGIFCRPAKYAGGELVLEIDDDLLRKHPELQKYTRKIMGILDSNGVKVAA
ncbi:MAG: hypothetical protein KAI53_02600 [Candidatus Aenigmarchaeota archaeon]|nr:hypothetical protein [Candidatus Aenigmarchaeota archaeon]